MAARWTCAAVLGAAAFAAPGVAAPALTAAETVAAYAAAGYVTKGTAIAGCAAENTTSPPSRFDLQIIDLNIDGRSEAIIGETNAACYGSSGSSFTIVGKDVGGRWHRFGGTVGIAVVRPSRSLGWSDIEVQLPGPGRPRVLRWSGIGYR